MCFFFREGGFLSFSILLFSWILDQMHLCTFVFNMRSLCELFSKFKPEQCSAKCGSKKSLCFEWWNFARKTNWRKEKWRRMIKNTDGKVFYSYCMYIHIQRWKSCGEKKVKKRYEVENFKDVLCKWLILGWNMINRFADFLCL